MAERIDDLMVDGLRIIQDTRYFAFGMDAVLLARFVRVKKGARILDLGTGTGVVPLLLSSRVKDAAIYGLEIQPELANLARRSVQLNGLTDTIRIDIGDLRQATEYYGHEVFDVVTCNPPYMPLEIGPVSPKGPRAIARHEITCTLEDVVKACGKLVRFGGRAALVYRTERLVDLISLLRAVGLEPKRLRLVQPKAQRAPNIFLVEAIKGARPGLHTMPALVVYDDRGEYTEELQKIYYPNRFTREED